MKPNKLLTLTICIILLATPVSAEWLVKSNDGAQILLDDGSIVVGLSQEEIVLQARQATKKFNFDTYKKKAVWSDAEYSLKGYFLTDQVAGQIMYYDGRRVKQTEGARGILPRIGKAGITWIDPMTHDLYYSDGTSVTRIGNTIKSNIGSREYKQERNIGNHLIAWFENVGNPFQNEVMVYNTKTGVTTQVTKGNEQVNYNADPSVKGNKVAWEDNKNGGSYYKESHIITGKTRTITEKQFNSFSK